MVHTPANTFDKQVTHNSGVFYYLDVSERKANKETPVQAKLMEPLKFRVTDDFCSHSHTNYCNSQ